MAESVTTKLKDLRNRAGLSMGRMAKLLGFKTASGYQHYEDPDLYRRPDLPTHIVKNLLDILPGRGSPPISKEEVLMLGGMHGLSAPQLDFLDQQLWVQCIGEVADGVWLERLEWPEDLWKPLAIAVRDERHPGVRRRAFQVRGDSVNDLYPNGSFVIFVRFADIRDRPKAGDRVVVIRRRHDDLIEATVKQVTKDERGKLWLVPRSKNPVYRAIAMDSDPDATITVEVMGLVVGSQTIE